MRFWLPTCVGLIAAVSCVSGDPPPVGGEIVSLVRRLTGDHPIYFYQPEQIHLSFGENVTDVVVTWATLNATTSSVVEYGLKSLNQVAKGKSTLFVDGGMERRFQYIHRVTLKNLQPLQQYVYHCGSEQGWSNIFFFRTVKPDENWSPRLLVYGDMGNVNARSLPFLQEEVQKNEYDTVLHVGDFAYDMHDDNGRVGDAFLNQLTPIAAYVPYMVSPGNHENAYNFSHYKSKFSMPGPYENLMYSFNLGPAHFISINTEAYYFLQYGIKQMVKQFQWLEQDLAEANKPENRQKRPWIITYGHRPMYCSDDDGDDCTTYSSRVRVGVPLFDWFGLEKLFYDNGVDLEIWAHEHSYERLFPVFDHKVFNGSTQAPYTNPKAPVHFITGSAGCQEFTDNFFPNPLPWSAFRSSDYGYTRMQIFNKTHLYWEQVSVMQDRNVIDSTWLIKEKHGKYE